MNDPSIADIPISRQPTPRAHWRQLFLLGFRNPLVRKFRRLLPASLRRKIRLAAERKVYRQFQFERGADWLRITERHVEKHVPALRSELPPPATGRGLNLHGYFSRWLGLGECARLYARALLSSGFPVSLYDVDIDVPHARNDKTLSTHMRNKHSFNKDLIFVNPDHWEEALSDIEKSAPKNRYVIGYWFWELEHFPQAWLSALDRVDEIMVSTAFVEQAIRRVTDKPVTRVPLPMVLAEDSGLQRRHFGLNEKDYIFFASFDFNSALARKNPFAVIEAFRKAFPEGSEPVCLLIKSCNGDRDMPMLMHLAEMAAKDPRILLRDDLMTRMDLQSLHRCIDVHVSLHRSEGFGLGMAEAMCMSKPVIATAYSGNMEFMTEENSCLVDYEMIPVKSGEYQHGEGQYWAEASVLHAARHMRTLYLDRALGVRLGEVAARDIATQFSVDACMKVLLDRLSEIDFGERVPEPLLSNASRL